MAISRDGIHGATQGRIGNIVYYMRKGKPIVRKIGISQKQPTQPQLENRLRMSIAHTFCKTTKPFIDYGFALQILGRDLSQYNVALSYNKINAIKGEYPNLELNYAKALISEGPLLQADDARVEIAEGGLRFNWYVPADLHWPDTTDQVMLLVYFPEEHKVVYELFGVPRTAGTALLEIGAPMLTQRMETYLAFISADRKQVATSVYVGSLNT